MRPKAGSLIDVYAIGDVLDKLTLPRHNAIVPMTKEGNNAITSRNGYDKSKENTGKGVLDVGL